MSASPEYNPAADSAPDEAMAADEPAVEQEPEQASASPSPPPEASNGNGKKRKAPLGATQLIDHLPRAEGEALRTFLELKACTYQNMQLGRSRNVEEGFACECAFDPDDDPPHVACGADSDCINRLTQIECLEDECRCGSYCQNQRFAKRQYAQLHIVQTEKKGFGLRAATDLKRDDFIYEYLGEVVNNTQFMKRMRDYADEGIRHFYFMMLQKDEFIDATKKGGIGRFANHSCNPNCYVAKWTVGKRIRMGIFAQRNIKAGEELTFNYNVDRYGHEAQPCYCGEPNCVGFIGGKTQTDVAVLDDLLLDALGISDEVEALGLKGNKKRKGRKLDEDYMPAIRPLSADDMPKIMQAIKQTSSRKILERLLGRVKITEDLKALRRLLHLRVLSALGTIFEDYPEDDEMKVLVLNVLETLTTALLTKNKIEASKLEIVVKPMAESENGSVRVVAEKVLESWKTLEKTYRIPKRAVVKVNTLDASLAGNGSGLVGALPVVIPPFSMEYGLLSSALLPDLGEGGPLATGSSTPEAEPVRKRPRVEFALKPTPPPPPPPPRMGAAPSLKPHPRPRTPPRRATAPQYETPGHLPWLKKETAMPIAALAPRNMEARMIQEIIAQSVAARDAAAAANRVPDPPPPVPALPPPVPVRRSDAEIEERARERLRRRKERKARREREKAERREREKGKGKEDRETKKELQQKHLRKLVGGVVVKDMGRWQKYLNREQFKEHAQKMTEKIADSEQRHAHGDSKKLDKLSEKQIAKIHGFVKSYMEKTVYRIRKEAKAKAASSSSGAPGESSATPPVSDRTEKTEEGPDTPQDEHGDADVRMGEAEAEWDAGMALYDDLPKELSAAGDAMDTDSDSDSDDDSEDEADHEGRAAESTDPAAASNPPADEQPAQRIPDEPPAPRDMPSAPVAIAV